jgi:hypothetical protein
MTAFAFSPSNRAFLGGWTGRLARWKLNFTSRFGGVSVSTVKVVPWATSAQAATGGLWRPRPMHPPLVNATLSDQLTA